MLMRFALVLLAFSFSVFAAVDGVGVPSAQAQSPSETETVAPPALPKLVVGTKPAAPFAIKNENGKWTGLGVELWDTIATRMQREYTFKEFLTVKDLIAAAESGAIDVGVAATTITAEREKLVDFSYPFYNSGLGIAVSNSSGAGLLNIFAALASPDFLATIGTLIALLLVTGAVIWALEHKRNQAQFHKDPVEGIGSGFWWAAVTMTTVGYGDKAPITPLGRAVAVVWMFAALILTAVFTAQLASSLTASKISGAVTGVGDLSSARVGTVSGAASNDYFDREFIRVTAYQDVAGGLAALQAGRISAFVHDEPILKFEVQRLYSNDLSILPEIFEPQDYGIVLPEGSTDRETINRALLEIVTSPQWAATKATYFGRND